MYRHRLSHKERFLLKVDKQGPFPDPKKYPKLRTRCWLWLGCKINTSGYGVFGVERKQLLAHRFSYEAFKGKLHKKFALHKCDNPSCVNPDHLFKGTDLDNARDCIAKGRAVGGRANRKLSSAQVRKMCRMRLTHTDKHVARFFGVSRGTVYRVTNGILYRHVRRA